MRPKRLRSQTDVQKSYTKNVSDRKDVKKSHKRARIAGKKRKNDLKYR